MNCSRFLLSAIPDGKVGTTFPEIAYGHVMDVLMPQVGETVAEGKVTTWFKQVGEPVKAGENLFEIETDKVTMEIQAVAGGVLSEIRVNVGDVAKVGAVVAIIGDGPSGTASSPAVAATPAPVAASTTAATPAPVAARPAAAAAPAAPAAAVPSGPIKLDPYREVRTSEKDYGPARANGRAITPLARRLAAEAGIDVSK